MSIYLFSRIVIISFPLQFQQKMTGEAEERRAETKKNREKKKEKVRDGVRSAIGQAGVRVQTNT